MGGHSPPGLVGVGLAGASLLGPRGLGDGVSGQERGWAVGAWAQPTGA